MLEELDHLEQQAHHQLLEQLAQLRHFVPPENAFNFSLCSYNLIRVLQLKFMEHLDVRHFISVYSVFKPFSQLITIILKRACFSEWSAQTTIPTSTSMIGVPTVPGVMIGGVNLN